MAYFERCFDLPCVVQAADGRFADVTIDDAASAHDITLQAVVVRHRYYAIIDFVYEAAMLFIAGMPRRYA